MTIPRLAYTVAGPDCYKPDPFAFHAPFDETLNALAESGYQGIELQVRNPREIDLAPLRRSIESSGLTVPAIATGHVLAEDGLHLSDPDRREEAVARFEEIVDFAAEFDAMLTLGKSRGGAPPDKPDQVAGALDAIGRLGARAADAGIMIALEPQNRFNGPLLTSIGDTVESIEKEGWVGVGICADTFHMAIEERSFSGALVEASRHLIHVQLGENHRGPMGDGTVPLSAVVHVLEALGYDGWLCMEHGQAGDSFAAARRSAQAVAIAAAGPRGN